MDTSAYSMPENEPSTNPLDWYASYPFDKDETYQQGLASILAGGALDGNPSSQVRDEILRRTRVFYFNKMTGCSISVDEARLLESGAQPTEMAADATSSQPAETSEEPRVLTFAELKELIETGKVDQIPNNKIIPEGINDAPPSQSSAPARKKPWETSAAP